MSDPLDLFAAAITGLDSAQIEAQRCSLMGAAEESGIDGSILNYDGLPVQLCLSLGKHSPRVRWVVDSFAFKADPEVRFARSAECLDALLHRQGDPAVARLAKRFLSHFGPNEELPIGAFDRGVFWLAEAIGVPGLALYLDLGPLVSAGQQGSYLDAVGRWFGYGTEMSRVLSQLAGSGELVSLGLEGSAATGFRLKQYWRMRRAAALKDTGIELLADPRFNPFLQTVLADQDIQGSGLTLSVGFDASSGKLTDAKVDICACPRCIRHTSHEWHMRLQKICDEYKLNQNVSLDHKHLDILTYLAGETAGSGLEVAVVGLGLSTKKDPRLNIYLKKEPRES
jgi:hypothetical protein